MMNEDEQIKAALADKQVELAVLEDELVRLNSNKEKANAAELSFKNSFESMLRIYYQLCKKIIFSANETWGESIGAWIDSRGQNAANNLKPGGRVETTVEDDIISFFNKKDKTNPIYPLIKLWNVTNRDYLEIYSRDFLALFKDISTDEMGINERINKISLNLCQRCSFAIHKLHNSDKGTRKFAKFLADSMVKEIPKSPWANNMANSTMSANERIEVAVLSAIPKNENDGMYKKNPKLQTRDVNKDWSVRGLLIRSPIFMDDNYYVRDDAKRNKMHKYPLQVVSHVTATKKGILDGYRKADNLESETISRIRSECSAWTDSSMLENSIENCKRDIQILKESTPQYKALQALIAERNRNYEGKSIREIEDEDYREKLIRNGLFKS